MQKRKLGNRGPEVSGLGYGAMGLRSNYSRTRGIIPTDVRNIA